MIPDWLWVVWLAAVAVSFGAIEGVAIHNRRGGDTLTENLRRWLGISPPRPGRRVAAELFAAAVLGFAAWLVQHIVG